VPDQYIDGPQGRLAASVSANGLGVPIVFVHSDGGTLHHWDDIRSRLTDCTTAAFDRRGHGGSELPRNGSFAHAEGAEDIAAVANALEFSKFILVGHSGGAANAFTFAGYNSERLAGLVLVAPPPDPKSLPPGMDQQIEAMMKDYTATLEGYYRSIAGDDPAVIERVLADARATPKETVIGTMKAFDGFQPLKIAPRLTQPTLAIIQSQFDVDGALHRIPPGFRHVAIDGAGHWIHLGAPVAFARALRSFLDAVD
jgi:pimeloyl-ACP methyl ester carboxylesterase